jgi:predicted O-methyltransferase YrrM
MPIIKSIIRKIIEPIIPSLYTRPMIELVKTLGNNLIGVEIGVSGGFNAKNILLSLPIKKLYLVDPYETFMQNGESIKQHDGEEYEKAWRRLKEFEFKVEFILKDSCKAVKDIPNNLDFVYIDGNHSYKSVKRDIENYYPKVKKGGILGGHDYSTENRGVMLAVGGFANKNNLEINDDGIDWWFIK